MNATETRRWQWLAGLLVLGFLVWKLAPILTPFVISAGLGWLGDPLVDLGTALAYWAGPDDVLYPVFGSTGITLAADLSKSEMLERYAARTGFAIGDVAFYQAFAMLRIAVIVQQIYIRWLRGQTSDGRFSMLGMIVPPIAETALAMLD